MSLMPKRVKYRKSQKGRNRGLASRGNTISFGQYALQSLEGDKVSSQQIEAARVAINRHARRGGKIWIRIFPDKPITKKPAETRMGKGKGAPEGWVALVQPGRILFEMDGIPEKTAKEALRLAAYKLPVKTRFITRSH